MNKYEESGVDINKEGDIEIKNGKVTVQVWEWECPFCKKKVISVTKEKLDENINNHLLKCKMYLSQKYYEELKKKGYSDEDIRLIAEILRYDKAVKALKRFMKKYNLTKDDIIEMLEDMERIKGGVNESIQN